MSNSLHTMLEDELKGEGLVDSAADSSDSDEQELLDLDEVEKLATAVEALAKEDQDTDIPEGAPGETQKEILLRHLSEIKDGDTGTEDVESKRESILSKIAQLVPQESAETDPAEKEKTARAKSILDTWATAIREKTAAGSPPATASSPTSAFDLLKKGGD